MTTDLIDKAVEATETQVRMSQAQVNLPSGRPMVIALPADITDVEALQSVAVLLAVVDRIRAQQPKHGLVLARSDGRAV